MSHLASYSNQKVLAHYQRWDAQNPDFYPEFVNFTKQLLAAGHSQVSASLVMERIRWERAISTTGDEFKLNNNFQPIYARRFMDDYPQLGDVFRLRSVH